jgi:hypothetical protein
MDAENIYQAFEWLWCPGQLLARNIEGLPKLEQLQLFFDILATLEGKSVGFL